MQDKNGTMTDAVTQRYAGNGQDPGDAFRARILERIGFDPDRIVFDNQLHRFKGKGSGKSGWYRGFTDRAGGVYGDWLKRLSIQRRTRGAYN